jgi:hypothetical protein
VQTETKMPHRTRVYLAVFVALALMAGYWGCDRLSGEPDANQLPEVRFINVPLDSTTFNYAPVVRWVGYDPDGMVVGYQYHDDSTHRAVEAYQEGDEALRAYIETLAESSWVTTYQTSDTIYLRRGEHDSITQHVFMVRCVDDQGGISPVKVRTFFRTNNAPNAPKVKWLLDATLLDNVQDYQVNYVVPDTIFWGDSTTITYPGIGFLWQGSDPDSRELNIIPLTFSWVLVCDRDDGRVDTMPHPVYDDSNRVSGFALGWSPWNDVTQVTFGAWYADSAWCLANLGHYFELDGRYRFLVRARDDGLTEADTMAVAHFTAIRPIFDRQLLIIDWTRRVTGTDMAGGRASAEIRAFYDQLLPEAFNVAEQFRQIYYPSYMMEPIPFDTAWYNDSDLNATVRTPYDYIRHFKWVWVIHDNSIEPAVNDPERSMYPRLKVFMNYMDVGGQLMMSGRHIFDSCFLFRTPGALSPGPHNVADNFFYHYCGLSTIYPALAGTSPDAIGDFAGVRTTDTFLDSLVVDTAAVKRLRFGIHRYTYLPEVDYFGRTTGRSGYDYASTIYNYQSSTAFAQYDTTNVDLEVIESQTTPSYATLKPLQEDKPILRVSRVYNRTRNVYGEVIRWWRQPHTDQWRILVSTPASAGAWRNADLLEVDYTFIPIEESHDEPVSTNFNRVEGVIRVDFSTGSYSFEGHTRFRAAVVTFPLSFLKNDYTRPAFPLPGEYHPVAKFLAAEILFFNAPMFIDYGRGQGGPLP